MVEKISKKVMASFEENTAYMEKILPVKDSFDIIRRDMVIGESDAAFYFIDGFIKDETMLKIMDAFSRVTKEDMPGDATAFARRSLSTRSFM